MKKTIMDSKAIKEAVENIAAGILKSHTSEPGLVLIGLVTRGACLARRISDTISKTSEKKIPVGSLDITFYRDDVGSIARQPLAKQTTIPVDITGKKVILVDDVLFTGRSIRAALDELMDFGRPAAVQLAVLIDRGRRELPIQADFTGVKVETDISDEVKVNLKEIDGKDEAVLLRGKNG
jgi:pyrimidine operon attenuation protein/uracil phosphoribosyltransferase